MARKTGEAGGDAADGRRHHNMYDIHDEHDPGNFLAGSAEEGPGRRIQSMKHMTDLRFVLSISRPPALYIEAF